MKLYVSRQTPSGFFDAVNRKLGQNAVCRTSRGSVMLRNTVADPEGVQRVQFHPPLRTS